jgi:amino acid transporter
VQSAIALALVAFGAAQKDGFEAMVEFTAPVFWLFFMLSGLALFILRRRDPTVPRPFRVPLYPVLPLAFVLSCGYVLYSSIVHAQTEHATYVAFGVMLSGAVALLLLRRRR